MSVRAYPFHLGGGKSARTCFSPSCHCRRSRSKKVAYPRQYRAILSAVLVLCVGLGVWGSMEIRNQPSFHPNDLITPGEPLVVRVVAAERNTPTISCIMEAREHLAVVDVGGGTLKPRVETNSRSGPSCCPIGAAVQVDPAWLHDYTLTHRHS